MKTAAELKELVASVPDFPKPGIVFKDISPLLKNHFDDTIAALCDLIDEATWAKIEVIGGIESRGFIFAAAMAQKMGKGMVLLRKPGKLPNCVASAAYALEYGEAQLEMQRGEGESMLLVDDVLATGGTLGAAASLCAEAGFHVEALACLINLKDLNQFNWNGLACACAIEY
jgi:adenine phosphoribosyltransferase